MPPPRQHNTNAERQAAYRQRQAEARRHEQKAKGLPAAPPIPTMPSMARWRALHEQARASLQTMFEEMEAYRDERSEQWQEGEKGVAFQEMLDRVEEAFSSVDELTLD